MPRIFSRGIDTKGGYTSKLVPSGGTPKREGPRHVIRRLDVAGLYLARSLDPLGCSDNVYSDQNHRAKYSSGDEEGRFSLSVVVCTSLLAA